MFSSQNEVSIISFYDFFLNAKKDMDRTSQVSY